MNRLPLKDRFMNKVLKETKPDGCWIWAGNMNRGRRTYGMIRVNGRKDLAHRVAYRLFHGEIPEKAVVVRTCACNLCVNPTHLRAEELSEVTARNNKTRVQAHPSKYSDTDVEYMRIMRKAGDTYEVIAAQYKCTANHARLLVTGKVKTLRRE